MEEIAEEERELLRGRRIVVLGHPPINTQPLIDDIRRRQIEEISSQPGFEPHRLRTNSRQTIRQTANGSFTWPEQRRRRGR